MTIRIDRAVTEVLPEPEAPPPPQGETGEPSCDDALKLRKALHRLRCRELRTRAEGFDD